MATYGDGLGHLPGWEADARRVAPRDVADDVPNALPAPVVPPPILPAAQPTAPAPGPAAFPAPDRSASPATSMAPPAASSVPLASAAPPNSYTDIRAVHEATTQQLRERRTSPGSGRAVVVACAVVVFGGIAFVLGTVLL